MAKQRKTVTFVKSALHRASSENNLSQLKEIITQNNEDVNKRDMFGFTPLMDAAINNNSDSISFLYHRGADLDMTDNGGLTALAHAAGHGHVNAIASLISCGADLNKAGEEVGQTPLMRAAQFYQIYCVKVLIDCGADIEAVNGSGKTALFYACEQGDAITVDYLLQNNANPNNPNHTDESSPLLVACKKGFINICLQLLKRGADPNASNAYGMTCLHYAVRIGNATLVEKLLEMGANLLACDLERRTPIHAAAGLGQVRCLSIMLRKTQFTDTEDETGKTALMHACESRSIGCVEILLDAGSPINHQSSVVDKLTPLMIAGMAGDYETVKLLLHRGANPNLMTASSSKAIDLVQNRRIIELLRNEEGGGDIGFSYLLPKTWNFCYGGLSVILFFFQFPYILLKSLFSERPFWLRFLFLMLGFFLLRLTYFGAFSQSILLGKLFHLSHDPTLSNESDSAEATIPNVITTTLASLATASSSAATGSNPEL